MASTELHSALESPLNVVASLARRDDYDASVESISTHFQALLGSQVRCSHAIDMTTS